MKGVQPETNKELIKRIECLEGIFFKRPQRPGTRLTTAERKAAIIQQTNKKLKP